MFPGNARPSLVSRPGRTVEGMNNRDEVRDFLTSRRDRLTPGQAAVPLYGGRRRVKGLRREEVAMLAALRIEAGRNPYDRGLTDLVGELSTRSEEFRTWWASHNVKFHTMAAKTLRHPAVGELELTGEALTLPGDHGLTIITCTVEPHGASEQALNFLASWSAQASPVNPRESETIEETK